MNNLFDKFTVKRRNFIVKEGDIVKFMKLFPQSIGNLIIGNCKWAEEPDSWFVNVDVTDNEWKIFLEECKENKYQLVIKDIPDRMYFTKIEGSK